MEQNSQQKVMGKRTNWKSKFIHFGVPSLDFFCLFLCPFFAFSLAFPFFRMSSASLSLSASLLSLLILLLVTFSVVFSADSVKPPTECVRMAFAFGQLHASPAVGEDNVIKQYKSAITIAMKCMDIYLKTQKEMFGEWLKQVSELEKQLQQIGKEEEKRGKTDDEL